jgi:hypothetical protein
MGRIRQRSVVQVHLGPRKAFSLGVLLFLVHCPSGPVTCVLFV